ncbi:pyridoxal-phosphate dependent enzyme [Bradyrhizobium sp. 25ACV]
MHSIFHHVTPVVESPTINQRLGRRIMFKMDCHQPAGSFKIRGIGHVVAQHVAAGADHFVCSSGGNAGLALAYCTAALKVRATIFVPATTKPSVHQLLANYGATVHVVGKVWDEADKAACDHCAAEGAVYVSPFNDPLLWQGHSTLVDELAFQIERPDAVVLSVGGGGLLCGVLHGMHKHGWSDVPVVAAETKGADSFAAAVAAGRPVALGGITSKATSLGALKVSDEAFRWTARHPIHSAVVTDQDAFTSCLTFANELRVLVEPACGAALAAVQQGNFPLDKCKNIVVIACGGNAVSVGALCEWATHHSA